MAAGTLIDLFDWWAVDRAGVPAVVASDDQVNFAELKLWSEAIADWLIAEGVEVGDRVTVIAANTLEYCALTQGVLRAGAILASVNPRFTLDETLYLIEKYEPKIILSDAANADKVKGIIKQVGQAFVISSKELSEVVPLRQKKVSSVADRVAINKKSPVVIIATSGSTGRPKGVIWSQRSIVNYLAEFALTEPAHIDHARILLFAPLAISAGYLLLTQYMAYGASVYIGDSFDPLVCLKKIESDKITSIMGAPVFLEQLAACDEFESIDLSNVTMVSAGGATVSQKLVSQWMSKGVVLRQIYGQTEAGGQITINTLDASISNPEKCGRGMPFTKIRIIDADGNTCPPNTLGEIVVKGEGIMEGYWRDPEATAKTIVDGWLRTGDLGVMDESGQLTFKDRLKDIIISGGLNISAAELERVVVEFDGVGEVVAIAAKDDKFGETPMLVIYAQKDINIPDLIDYCNQYLSDFKVPRYVVIEKEPLPRLAGGKIAKPVIRKKYANAHLELTKVR